MRLCVVVPHYDHVAQFADVLPRLACCGLPLLIVDDHSPEASYDRLAALVNELAPGATLLRLETNRGKGAAVQTGLRTAQDLGFSHALQVDADGQHDLESIGALKTEAERYPRRIICGLPQFGADMPALRHYARYLTIVLCRLEALSADIRDPMCGFRIYPLAGTLAICDRARLGSRMDFDPEVLVRARWAGIDLSYVPVKVVYPEHGRSHFHYLRDNLFISWMHTRLIAGMLLRLPALLFDRLKARATG